MKTLKLFNAVIAKASNELPFISNDGIIIESGAIWAKENILQYYDRERLSGNDLNKTFHKSWSKIKDSSRFELYLHQIMHYITTYGSNFTSEMYIPNEILDIPDLNLTYKVIKSYTVDEMTEKCLGLLKSGVALKEETVNDILTVLTDELKYTFTGKEGIKNKEAIVKIADLYNVLPQDVMEFFRYIIYKATNQTLLIKNVNTIKIIKKSNYNPAVQFNAFGLQNLAPIFNRFKPLFLAFKVHCPKTINKIAKLSKKYHEPLVANILNRVTSEKITTENMHWLDNATPFALFKALSACYSRMMGQDTFVYNIRNGKSYTKENGVNNVVSVNYETILIYLRRNFKLDGKKIFIPSGIEYALPTSEKMFVGNIPTGTAFYGDKLAVGVYWENRWGAYDLDVSALNIGGKIGWNSQYKQGDDNLMYSGDITNAPNGAVEYIYAAGLPEPTLVLNNVFSGDANCEYKIIIGNGDDITMNYMMNPNNLICETKCKSPQKQTILGIFMPNNGTQKFVVLNVGSGNAHVSGNGKFSDLATKALVQQWLSPIYLNDLVIACGGEIVEKVEDSDINLSMDVLEKDTFIKFINDNFKQTKS